MKYYVDLIDADDIVGWCYDPDAPGRAVTVSLIAGEEEVASVRAGLARPDVAERHGTHGEHGFRIPHGGNLADASAALMLRLYAPGKDSIELPVADLLGSGQVAGWTRVVPYLKGHQGAILIVSDTPSVLPALLSGDDRERVVERTPEALAAAEAGDAAPLFVCVPGVSSTSSLTPAWIEPLMSRLAPGGSVFLEVLLASEHPHAPEMNFHACVADGHYCMIPTMRGLREVVLRDHVVRYVAPSRRVREAGQFHILQVAPSEREIVLIAGHTRAGKSAFARSILRPRDQVINLDVLVGALRSATRKGAMVEGPLFEALRREPFSLPGFYREVQSGDALHELAGFLFETVFEGAQRVIVEGVVAGEEMADAIRSRTKGRFRILSVDLRSR